MKLSNLDGSPQEIRDLFDLHGLQISDYLEAPEQPSPKRWIVPPALALTVAIGVVLSDQALSTRWVLTLLVLGTAADGWLAATVHLCFRNKVVTWLALAVGFALVLMSAGVLLPKDALDLVVKHKPE